VTLPPTVTILRQLEKTSLPLGLYVPDGEAVLHGLGKRQWDGRQQVAQNQRAADGVKKRAMKGATAGGAHFSGQSLQLISKGEGFDRIPQGVGLKLRKVPAAKDKRVNAGTPGESVGWDHFLEKIRDKTGRRPGIPQQGKLHLRPMGRENSPLSQGFEKRKIFLKRLGVIGQLRRPSGFFQKKRCGGGSCTNFG
jgi:hypothetical protein